MSISIDYLKKGIRKAVLLIFSIIYVVHIPATAQKAIDFSLKDISGNPIRLSDYYNKNIILLNFWATWCLPCIKEFPHLQKFHDKYKELGLKVFSISIDGPETAALVSTVMKRYKYNTELALGTIAAGGTLAMMIPPSIGIVIYGIFRYLYLVHLKNYQHYRLL